MKTICVVIAYNEEKTVGEVLRKIKKYGTDYIDKILVVDDASQDKTVEVAKEEGVDVISHIINRGPGAAQKTGYEVAIRMGYDCVLQLDADGQHKPKYIPKFFKAFNEGDCDVVVGSRWKNKSHKKFSITRRSGVSFFSKFASMLTSCKFTDITSGYNLLRVEMLKELGDRDDKHPAIGRMMEICSKGFNIKEISVEMPIREKGKSQLDVGSIMLYPIRALENILKVLIFR